MPILIYELHRCNYVTAKCAKYAKKVKRQPRIGHGLDSSMNYIGLGRILGDIIITRYFTMALLGVVHGIVAKAAA